MKLHIREDMDISKYKLRKFVDALVKDAMDKISKDLNYKEFAPHSYKNTLDKTVVLIGGAVIDVSKQPEDVRYVLSNLDFDDIEFYIAIKQNKWDKQTYIHASRGYGNHYAKYFDDLDKLTSYVLNELVPLIVNNVNNAYRDYITKNNNSIKESYTPDEWDIERVAELVKFYLYDRGFESSYKIYRKDFTIRMWYKYENESYDRTVYLDDINWDWSEEEFEYCAKNKAEELARDYFEYID